MGKQGKAMLKKIFAAIGALFLGLALVAQPALARFDLHFASDLTGGGTAYEWYMPGLKVNFDIESRDGVMPTGEPYALFKGNSASPNGHCLEVSFTPGSLSSPPWIAVQVNDHGTFRTVVNVNLENGGYPTSRVWVHRNINIGSLNWALYLIEGSLSGGGFGGGQVEVDVRRLEVSKAGCTTSQVGGQHEDDPDLNPFPWVAFEGNSANYTITKGNF
jgi:hypothetical protein